MHDELEENQEEYCSLDHEYWYDLLSTNEVKYNRKSAATQIKRLATSKMVYQYNINEFIRVPHKKRLRNGVIPNRKQKGKKMTNNHGNQLYCVLCK